MQNNVIACMVLHSVGDTMGFKNGEWEFNNYDYDADVNYTSEIINQFIDLGGINDIDMKDWTASDDTVMHIATAEAILESKTVADIYPNLAKEYVKCFYNMSGRAPGEWTTKSIELLKKGVKWNQIPPAKSGNGAGNGSVMRASCIGLIFNKEKDLDNLISVAIESARITHNSPTGYLGAVAISYMISLAIQKVPITKWMFKLLKLLESKQIHSYLKHTRGVKEYEKEKDFFISMIHKYVDHNFNDKQKPKKHKFKKNPVYRMKYYNDNFAFPNSKFIFPGIGAHDSVIIAYDALLDSQYPSPSWEKLVIYSCLHTGDSDTVGAIACSLWGAVHGFSGVPQSNYKHLEFKKKLFELGEKIYKNYY